MSLSLSAHHALWLSGGIACVTTYALTPLIRSIAVRLGRIARPANDRWGRRTIARFGGVAMFIGLLASAPVWVLLEPHSWGLLAGATVVFFIGLRDDIVRMPPYTKLVLQLLASCIMVSAGLRVEVIPWPWLSFLVSVLWFVFVMNAFNLLDNMDGLAAGTGAIAAAVCLVHAVLSGQWAVATVAASVVGICVGFLRHNFPPAKIYMGDSGSHLLGLSLATLSLLGSWKHSTQLLSVLAIPTLILAVPIFDTCFVTLQRLTHRRHPFAGGTDHVSHRLAILGLSDRQTALALYSVSIVLGILSLVSATLKPVTVCILWAAVASLLLLVGRYLSQVKVYRIGASEAAPAHMAQSETMIETMLLHKRRLVEILVDCAVISSAYVGAHLLRFEGSLTGDLQALVIQSLPIILACKLMCLYVGGLYRGVWRYLSLPDLVSLTKAVTAGSVVSAIALLYLWRFHGYSRAVFIIDWMLTFIGVGWSRIAERLLDDWIVSAARKHQDGILIIGAGDVGELVLRFLRYEAKLGGRVIGFLDDDPSKRGTRIHGATVLGGRTLLPDLLEQRSIVKVLVAVTDPPGELLEYVRGHCETKGVVWKVVTAGVTNVV